MSDTQPLAYLITSSRVSLESYELSRLNRASNLRKEMLQALDRWIDAEAEARMARSILDWKRAEVCEAGPAANLRNEESAKMLTSAGMVETETDAGSNSSDTSEEDVLRLYPQRRRTLPGWEIGPDRRRRAQGRRRSDRKRAVSNLRFLERCAISLLEGLRRAEQISVSRMAIGLREGGALTGVLG